MIDIIAGTIVGLLVGLFVGLWALAVLALGWVALRIYEALGLAPAVFVTVVLGCGLIGATLGVMQRMSPYHPLNH